MAHSAGEPTRTIEEAVLRATQNVEDRYLAKRVERALRASGHGSLRGTEVMVDARLVILRGVVPSYYLKQMAQAIALAVPGTHRIRNELAVFRLS